MHPSHFLTPAETRFAAFLLILSLAGAVCPSRERPGTEVEAWLDRPVAEVKAADSLATPEPVAAAGAPAPGDTLVESAPKNPAQPVRAGVDPNRAGAAELIRLPGVGPVLAQRILDDRRINGPYQCAEDLLRVKGIGPATLARMRSSLALP